MAYHCFTEVEFGQVWAKPIAQHFIRLCKAGLTKSHMTLGNMEVLENRIAYDFVKPDLQNLIQLCKAGLTKSHMTLGNMEVLENRIAKSHTTLGSHDVTCRNLPKVAQIARHEEDHLCLVPYLRKSSLLR